MNKLLPLVLSILFFANIKAQVPSYTITALDSSSTGYYFLMPAIIHPGNMISHDQIILDWKGELVYYRPFIISQTPDFKVQPNGMISFFQQNYFTILDSGFVARDTVGTTGYVTDSHDFQMLPNGHLLLLGNETTIQDLSAYHMFNHNGTPGSITAQVKSNVIQEIDSAGIVFFEWHTKDHFAFDDVDENWLSSPTTVDWTHCNAVELDHDGNILLSTRHFNEITKINRGDSSIMWRMGGRRNEFTFLNDTIRYTGQHDIRRIDNGHVTLFDNGWLSTSGTPHFARALEYDLDESGKTANLVWSYVFDSTIYSRATGNVQRLPNGNTLINYGQIDTGNVTFTVVDSLGSKVFEIAFADTLFSYRSFNFQSLPWSFHRPEINCYDSSGTYYLDAGSGYAAYHWSNGSTTRFVPATVADTFSVFVPYGTGGYISSEKFVVDSSGSPCGVFALTENIEHTDQISVFPNPSSSQFTVTTDLISPAAIQIYNTFGELKICVPITERQFFIDGRKLTPGIYILKIDAVDKILTQKLIVE